MTDRRKLAYKGQPGEAHLESAWISARRWLQGENEEQAKAAIEKEISSGRVIIVEQS